MSPADPGTDQHEPEDSPQEDKALLHAVESAADAAKVGQNVKTLLREIASQFVPPTPPASSPLPSRSLVASVSTADLPRSPPNLPARRTMGQSVWNRADFVLKTLPQQQRARLTSLLSGDTSPLVATFGNWLRGGPKNLIPCVAAYFETSLDALASLEDAQHQAVDAVLGSDALDRIEIIRRYLHHKLAPSARKSHAGAREAGCAVVSEPELFLDLQQDPCFPDFINEMPRLLTDASLALYHALASVLPAGTTKDRMVRADGGDTPVVKRFLHLLCCQTWIVGEFLMYCHDRPASELEVCCIDRVLYSAAKALYLDFLHRRYAAMLQPAPPDDASAFDAGIEAYSHLLAIVEKVQQRIQDVKTIPPCSFLATTVPVINRASDKGSFAIYVLAE
jgi:hypothetical protein